MTTFADVKAAARLPEKTVSLCLRGDLQAEYEGLERDLKRAKTATRGTLAGSTEEAKALEDLMAGLREQMRENTCVFTLRALPKRKWSDLIAGHPPRDEDRLSRLDHNAETFPAAAIQACCIDPVMTIKEVEELCDEVLTQGQWDEIFLATYILNKSGIDVPF